MRWGASHLELGVLASPRPQGYVSPRTFAILRPFLRYSLSGDAYVLRGLGHFAGPALRRDRRSRGSAFADPAVAFTGRDRRRPAHP